ncbi:membrane-spanning protein [Neobacillus sp. SM06]|uniref:membrane-spanning protein n=1 Tax=Neobacillus sp. SM06 TaxID=3422492 RepID=UPI003D2C202F
MKSKLIIILSSCFIAFMAILTIYYVLKGDSSRWQVASGGILISALPLLLLLPKIKNLFPTLLIIGYFIFIFCTVFLGSIANFYINVKWWDTSLHFYKGMLVGLAAISLYGLLVPESAKSRISKWFIFLFVLSLSVLSSVIWEIYEFIGDHTYTHTMQRGGNTDTMTDLTAGFIGALFAAVYSITLNKK